MLYLILTEVWRKIRGCEETNSYCMQRKGRLKTNNIAGFQNTISKLQFFSSHKKVDDK